MIEKISSIVGINSSIVLAGEVHYSISLRVDNILDLLIMIPRTLVGNQVNQLSVARTVEKSTIVRRSNLTDQKSSK